MIEVADGPAPLPEPTVKRKRGRPVGAKNKVYSDGNLPPDTREQDAESTDTLGLSGDIQPFPAIAKESTPEAIFHLWNECLTLRQRELGNVYLYREHPKYLLTLEKGRMVNKNIRKFIAADGAVTKDAIWKEFRAGTYTIRLVQRIVRPHGEISKATLKLEGDFATTDEMPNIDLDRLDREHPDNQSYVRILRLRGIIKDDANAEESEDMAASEVLGTIAQSAITQLSERREPAAPAPANDSGAVREVVSLLRDTINNSKPPEQQGSVTDHVKSLVDIAKSMAPPAVNLEPFMELQRQNNELVRQMMEKEVERAKSEAETAKAEVTQLREAIPKAKTIDEQFDDLERAAQRYKRIRGESDEPEERQVAHASPMGFWSALPAILEKGERILSLVANMGFNFAVVKTGGTPVNPATGAAGSSPAQPELSADQQEQAERMQSVINQLVPLAQPMLRHLQQGKSGTDFAKFVLENFSPQTLAVVQGVEGGRDTILGLLQSYPPVWTEVSSTPHNLSRFTLFLDQFLAYQTSVVQ